MSLPPLHAPADQPTVSRQLEFAVYGAATFSNSLGYMVMVAVPLWVVTLDPSPLMVGIVLGSRHILVLLYSIHGGAMMDRLGPRRVMIAFAAAGVVLPLLYPLLPYLWALIALQIVAGYASAIGWVGAQALIGGAMRGSAVHAGRMSAIIRVGVVIGPFLTGLAWDLGGPWGAFGVLALWGAGLLLSCIALPAADTGGETTARFSARDLVPRLADYVTALGLLALPIISVVMMVTVIRITGFAMQASFYAVYLEGAGYTGTLIGVLLSAFGAFGGVGALLMGSAARRFAAMPLLFVMVAVTIIAISLTPVLGTFWLLFIAAAANGGAYGLSQPLVITLTARGAGAGNQGKAVALRTTANRVAATFIPIVMGAVVEFAGLANAFYIIGGFFLVLLALVARRARGLPGVWHGTGP